MCGIIAVTSNKKTDISKMLIKGLQALEYRGYDSAGILTKASNPSNKNNWCKVTKSVGGIDSLQIAVDDSSHNFTNDTCGIAHTRWATHGGVNIANTHPHVIGNVAIVHNGIIENHKEIRDFLREKDYYLCKGETDTEVMANLIDYYLSHNDDNTDKLDKTEKNKRKNAFFKAVKQIKGSSAIVAVFNCSENNSVDSSDEIYAFKNGSPLIVGKCSASSVVSVASDTIAITDIATEYTIIPNNSIVYICGKKINIYDAITTKTIDANFKPMPKDALKATDKGKFEDFMLKEIFEQGDVVRGIIKEHLSPQTLTILPTLNNVDLSSIDKIVFVGCGSSYYSGLTMCYFVQKYLNIEAEAKISSEFEYQYANFNKKVNTLCVFISQSGETIDTISAMNHVKKAGQKCLSILNSSNSTMESMSDYVLHCNCGKEIGVAATKTFTAQTLIGLMLVLKIGRDKKLINMAESIAHMSTIQALPKQIDAATRNSEKIASVAKKIIKFKRLLFIGKGTGYPLAMEGALKMKEISYLSAEGVASGELKHGTIAMIDSDTLTVSTILKESEVKSLSSLEEISSRDGKFIVLCSKGATSKLTNPSNCISEIQISQDAALSQQLNQNERDYGYDDCEDDYEDEDSGHGYNESMNEIDSERYIWEVFSSVVNLQLLSYHTAKALNKNIDKPRNLAKSVTVE